MKDCPLVKAIGKDYLKEDKNPSNIVEIHCNLWKVLIPQKIKSRFFGNPKYNYYLDLGLMFDPAIRQLVFHLPFEFSTDDFKDLGTKLDQQELSSLIFNENVETSCSAGTFHVLQFSNKRLFVYPLSNQNLEVFPTTEKSETNQSIPGTNLTITINSTPDQTKTGIVNVVKKIIESKEHSETSDKAQSSVKNFIYIRFRLKLSSQQLNNIRREEFLSTDILQSIFSQNEMFDFRINDDREIDRKINEELASRSFFPFRISKVHFLFMCDTRNSVTTSSFPYITRFLETEKWGSYIDTSIPVCMLAHHWKDKKSKVVKIKSSESIEVVDNLESLSGLYQLSSYTKQEDQQSNPNYILSIEKATFSSFKLFFMLSYPHKSWWQISFYTVIAIILGCLGSLMASTIFPNQNGIPYPVLATFLLVISIGALIYIWYRLKKRSEVTFR